MFLIALNTLLLCQKMRPISCHKKPIYGFIGDMAHDINSIYETLTYFKIKPFIPLNSRSRRILPGPLRIDLDGTPICPSGNRMCYFGLDNRRKRLTWRCPKIYGSKADREKIICTFGPCSNTPFGRVIHTKPAWDIRAHPYPPRSSPRWKKTYTLRYQSEQINNLIKNVYGLDGQRSRSRYRVFWETILSDILVHLSAWVARISPGIVRSIAYLTYGY
ncbi:MAG: hypothetical protein HPY52_15150 [Firmicutes bacterium]|nr:hypothetical protein [Bacillota bacterium]